MAKRRKRREEDPDRAILDEAKKRFRRVSDWEQNFQRLYVQDTKFAEGDSDNGWQWPDDQRRDREANKRPALTLNFVARHVNLITNDARQNKPSISMKPANDEASFESAQIYEGLIRDIEYKSRAQDVYDDATDSQVKGGIGYWRVEQYYPDDKSFDQALRISPVKNHLGVYIDPNIKQKSGLDAQWGFVFDQIPRDEFEIEYPDIDPDRISQADGITGDNDDWMTPDYVRIAEYYRLVKKADTLWWVQDPQTKETTEFLESQAPRGWRDSLVDGYWRKRKVETKQLQWFKIAGNIIVDRDEHRPGQYIPLVRCVGIELIIEGKLVRKGFVRALKDAQRMINYNASAEVESAALATKTKWVGAADAFSGNEVAWNNANVNNAAYLTFNHLDSEGEPLPMQALPQRIDPAAGTPAYIQGMQMAELWLQRISGQEASQLGQGGNERSGRAINERQRQADIATYLFVNNLAIAIATTGEIIKDLVPHVYDTKRVLQILGQDGTRSKVTMDPEAEAAYQAKLVDGVNQVLFNPNVGRYEVHAEVGPAYSTQRQEAFNAFTQIVTSAPELMSKIGDLLFRTADFPQANDIAERLRREIEANMPYLLGQGPTPAMQQMQAALQQAQGQVAELIQKLAEKNLDIKNKEEEHRIWQYEAESKRLTAETNAIVDMKKMQIELNELMQTIMQTLGQMQRSGTEGDSGAPVPPQSQVPQSVVEQPVDDLSNPAVGDVGPGDEARPAASEEPPEEGATRGEDGNWYVERDGQRYVVLPGVGGNG